MALVAAGYAGTILWETRIATGAYGPLWLEATGSEVRYVLGPPRVVEGGGTVYRYSERGRELAVRFSSEGRMVSLSCAPGVQKPSTCPEIRGIGIGDSEGEILLRLGAPSRQSYSGNDKTIHYDGMGLTFRLSRLKVRGLELREGASFIGYFPRALLALVP